MLSHSCHVLRIVIICLFRHMPDVWFVADEALSNEILSEATPNLDITPNTDKLMALIDPSAQVAQVAGILPGIGVYDVNTSDSESSSAESDIEDYMVTRKIVYAKVHVQEN